MIVEDGTGIADADSYVTLNDAIEYCTDRGLTFAASPSALGEAALIRASTAIDARYSSSYPGDRTNGRGQGLQWPRTGAYDSDGWLIPEDEIPIEVFNATVEAAVREFASPNSMMPDLERGGEIQSIRAGSVGITYSSNASAKTEFTLIDGIMANVLSGMGGSGGGLFGTVVRG